MLATARPGSAQSSSVRTDLSIDELRSEWDALADRVGALSFLRPGWIDAWWRAFGNGRLIVFAVQHGGSLHAVLPLAVRRGTIRSLSNWHTPEFGLLCSDRSAARMLLDDLFQREIRRISLGFLDPMASAFDELAPTAKAARRRVVVRPLERSPYVGIDGEWSSYERGLSGNLRRDVGRSWRRLAELGEVTLDVATGSSRLDHCLAEAFAIERSGWKAARGTAVSSRPQTQRFYAEVARWAAERDCLRLIFLRVDGRPIAFHFAIEERGVYFALKGGFDPVFHRYSPGRLLIWATLERAFAIGLRGYELLGSDDDYKLRWATGTHERLLLQAFAPTVTGLAEWWAFAHARPRLKRMLGSMHRR